MRLKPKEVAAFREQLLKDQNSICPLLGTEIEEGQEVLDHDHITGYCRAVLSRNTNAIEGRILSFIGRLKGKPDPVEFLKSLIQYWEADYSHNPLHPTHKMPEEIERTQLKKKLKKYKSDKKINETKQRIKELNKIIKEKS